MMEVILTWMKKLNDVGMDERNIDDNSMDE